MSELRKLAREVSELADRYDAVMALDEAALADLHRRAEAFERAVEWSKPSCGTRVGIDERGPWREQMVPRAALEWACGFADVTGCPPGSVKLCDGDCEHCWLQAALKAAEEATCDE